MLRLIGYCLLACIVIAPISVHAETLRSAVQKPLERNPEVGALRANRLAIDQELEAAKSLGRPRLDITASTGYVATHRMTTGGDNDLHADTRRSQIGGVLSVPVFDGHKTRSEVDRQANRVDSARFRVRDTASSLALQAVRAYLEVLRTRQIVHIARKNVAAHNRTLQRIFRRVKAGRSADAELSQIRARIEAARASVVEARARHADAVTFYISVVGEAPNGLRPYKTPTNRLPKTVNTAISVALAESPALAALTHDLKAAEAAIRSARSEFYPKVNVEVSANRRQDSDRAYDDQDDVSAMLVLRKNIYNGGRDTARVRETFHRANQVRFAVENARLSITKEIRLSWTAIKSASLRYRVIGRQISQNRKTLRSYEKQFDIGQRSLLDILDVQNEYFVNETTHVTEKFIASFNVFRILAAMGTLTEVMNAQLPEEATTGSWRPRVIIP